MRIFICVLWFCIAFADAFVSNVCPPQRHVPPQTQARSNISIVMQNGQQGTSTVLFDTSTNEANDKIEKHWTSVVTSDPGRSLQFSLLMILSGATLGPFLDSYHSAFGVLQYEQPLSVTLWGSPDQPALTTAWWVPELFGLAGFIIGWLYILLDAALGKSNEKQQQSPPKILVGISFFTLQYWLSGVMSSMGIDRTAILGIMSLLAAGGFVVLDATMTGLATSIATAVGGPLIEVGLLSLLGGHGGYQYLDKGETGFFPLWIVPVYFLGGPAVGNLARGFWSHLSFQSEAMTANKNTPCPVCNDTRCVGCPNCDAKGYYVTYGRSVKCNCCNGRGFVICRNCFSSYDEDPADIEAIRDLMARMPD